MQLLIWIGLCGAVAYLLRHRVEAALWAVLALWFLVPTVGSYLLTGQQTGPLSHHAATWLILSVAAVQSLVNPEALGKVIRAHRYFFLAIGLVLAVAFLTTRVVQSGGGLVLFVDQMVTPALFLVLIMAAALDRPRLVLRLRNLLMVLACVVVGVAIAQWSAQNVLFYEAGFETQFWFNPETERWMGTFDQPLALSLILCALAPMAVGIRRFWVTVPMLALFVVGVVISQSRVGIAVIIVAVLYAVLFSRHRPEVKAAVVAVLVAAALWLLQTPLVAGLLGRIEDDTGSTEARNHAYGVFFRDWERYAFTGDGLTASYSYADFAGLLTSFESSIMMYAVDIGIAFSALYFGALLMGVLRSWGRNSVPGLTFGALIVVMIPQTYSGVATRSVAGIVLWTLVAMAMSAGDAWREARAVAKETSALPPGVTPVRDARDSLWSGR